MRNRNFTTLITVFVLAMCITNTVYAANSRSIKYFISNNTQEIAIEKAYERTTSQFQEGLASNTIDLLQKNHIEQGRFEDVLGVYQMNTDKNITGDNTEIFLASPCQAFSNDQIFSLGKQLANTFQQESVAVFVPSNQATISDIVVKFTSNQPNIAAAVKLIREKLPAYANAFSLHLANKSSTFSEAKVSEIEWLGSKININEIKKDFSQDAVSFSRGKAYLVYKNGQIESI